MYRSQSSFGIDLVESPRLKNTYKILCFSKKWIPDAPSCAESSFRFGLGGVLLADRLAKNPSSKIVGLTLESTASDEFKAVPRSFFV